MRNTRDREKNNALDSSQVFAKIANTVFGCSKRLSICPLRTPKSLPSLPNSFVIKLDAYDGEQRREGIGARSRNSSVPGSTERSRFELNLFAASRPPVVEMRFSFLLTAAAVTPSKRMQFHPSGGSFSLTREKFTALPCRSRPRATLDTMLLKKCKLTRGLPYLCDARFTHESRDRAFILGHRLASMILFEKSRRTDTNFRS